MTVFRFLPSFLASEELIFSGGRPRRGHMALSQRWFGLLIAVGITLILLTAVVPYERNAGLAAIAGYWVYFLVKQWLSSRETLRPQLERKELQLLRTLALIVCVTALQLYLYLYTDFLARGGLSHTLWLLLLLGTLIVSRRSSTTYMLIALAAASASLVLTTLVAAGQLAAVGQPGSLALDLAERILWLVLLSFTLHMFVRFLGNLTADVELLRKVTGEMLEHEQAAIASGSAQNMADVLHTVVGQIRKNYGFPHVNVFRRMPDGALRCVAAASPAGQQLVDEGFELKNERSLVVKAATGKITVRCNDTDHTPDYLAHDVFSKTRAELIVPILRAEQLLGVLDVQAHRRGAFMGQDQAVMEVMAAQMARTMDNVGAHRWRRRFGELIQSIAARLLSQNDLEGTLQEIAEGARDLLGADIVALYERNPQTGAVGSPTCAGDLKLPDLVHAPRLTPGGLFSRLLADGSPVYYNTNLLENPPDPLFLPDRRRADGQPRGFEAREGVQARAVYKLIAGYDCAGIMFVNFRQPQEFDETFKKGAAVFADLAALAIRQAQLDRRELELQRQEIGALVHDQLKGNTDHAGKAIRAVLANDALAPADRDKLTAGLEMLDEMAQAIIYLNQSLEDTVVRPLSAEVEEVAKRLRTIYQMTVEVDWTAAADDLPAPYPAEIKLMLSELVLNALHHGKATHLALTCQKTDDATTIEVRDNGRGFNLEWVQPRGLRHARDRAERLRGVCEVQAAPGKGAHITIRLPLPAGQEAVA